MDKGFAVLEIDPEFKTLIRPLRKDEYLQLEVNLAVDGCREPITTWNNIIIDGHNRYEICNRLHIPYAIREMPFENREQAIVWICSNQLGRRNITEETRRYLIGKQYELEKVARKHPPSISGETRVSEAILFGAQPRSSVLNTMYLLDLCRSMRSSVRH